MEYCTNQDIIMSKDFIDDDYLEKQFRKLTGSWFVDIFVNKNQFELIYNKNLFGKIISMLIKGQKAKYSSLYKKIDTTIPLSSKPRPKLALSKAPSPIKL